MRLALVLWSGGVGGAERVTVALARAWQRLGVDARLVFILDNRPLFDQPEEVGVPFENLGLATGGRVLFHPSRLARAVTAAGPHGALVADCGYLAAVLRLGGYRGRIVGVEHGPLLLLPTLLRVRRIARMLERRAGARVRYVDVAVSDFMLAELRRHAHAPRICRIHNFLDPEMYATAAPARAAGARSNRLVAGCVSRLIPGKGVDCLIEALAEPAAPDVIVRIAGDGPERSRLEELARRLHVEARTDFLGVVRDIPAFWAECDVAVAPSHTWVESFGMAALEAMAAAKPVVATRNGGLPEVVEDGVAGTIIPPGHPAALAEALARYAADSELRAIHGAGAAEVACARFGVEVLARSYLALFSTGGPAE